MVEKLSNPPSKREPLGPFGIKKRVRIQRKMHSVFELLPVEVIYQILEKLPVKTLSVVSQVSRVFYNSCQDERLWRKEFIKCDNNAESANSMDGLPGSRLCHSCVTYGGYMWIHGGHNTCVGTQTFAEVKNDLWRYNFTEKTWEQMIVSNLPAKTEHSAVVYKNKMYLFGGYSGDNFTNTLYSYDFTTNECVQVSTSGDIPPIRSAHIGVVHNDRLYIFGGWNGDEQNNDMFYLDFTTLQWTKVISKGQLPSPRCSHTGVVGENYQSLYVFAGYGGKDKRYLNDLCQFNFETEIWTVIDHTPPSPRSRMRIVEFNDKLYIYGGWNKSEHFNNLFQFDISFNRWNEVRLDLDALEGKIGQHSMVVYNNILYVFAGYNSALRSSTNDLYAYRLCKPNIKPLRI